MREIGFLAVLSIVTYVTVEVLPVPINEEMNTTLVGVVAVFAGRGLWFTVDKKNTRVLLSVIVFSSTIFLLSLFLYLKTADSKLTSCAKDFSLSCK